MLYKIERVKEDMKDKIQEEIFEFVYKMAFQDAVWQKAYEGKKKDLYEISEAKEVVEKYAYYIIERGHHLAQEEHDKIFRDTALKLCKVINKDDFTLGNAQKLINMTAKYLYILYVMRIVHFEIGLGIVTVQWIVLC